MSIITKTIKITKHRLKILLSQTIANCSMYLTKKMIIIIYEIKFIDYYCKFTYYICKNKTSMHNVFIDFPLVVL